MAAARREAGEIVEDARVQSERMVQRTEIVRQSEHRALRLVEDAEAEARRLRHEADDYIDQKLAGFEIVLDRTMTTVRNGRERLASVPAETDADGADYGRSGGAQVAAGARVSGIPRTMAGHPLGSDPSAGAAGGEPDAQDEFFDQDSEMSVRRLGPPVSRSRRAFEKDVEMSEQAARSSSAGAVRKRPEAGRGGSRSAPCAEARDSPDRRGVGADPRDGGLGLVGAGGSSCGFSGTVESVIGGQSSAAGSAPPGRGSAGAASRPPGESSRSTCRRSAPTSPTPTSRTRSAPTGSTWSRSCTMPVSSSCRLRRFAGRTARVSARSAARTATTRRARARRRPTPDGRPSPCSDRRTTGASRAPASRSGPDRTG